MLTFRLFHGLHTLRLAQNQMFLSFFIPGMLPYPGASARKHCPSTNLPFSCCCFVHSSMPTACTPHEQLEATARSDRHTSSLARKAPTTTFPARLTPTTAPTALPASTAPGRATQPRPEAATPATFARGVPQAPRRTERRGAIMPRRGLPFNTRARPGITTKRRETHALLFVCVFVFPVRLPCR